MALFRLEDSYYLGVSNVDATCRWYQEKFSLQLSRYKPDADSGEAWLGTGGEDKLLVLGAPNRANDHIAPVFFTSRIRKAHETLSERGVKVSEVRTDEEGTKYFEARDLEGNMVEVAEEP